MSKIWQLSWMQLTVASNSLTVMGNWLAKFYPRLRVTQMKIVRKQQEFQVQPKITKFFKSLLSPATKKKLSATSSISSVPLNELRLA